MEAATLFLMMKRPFFQASRVFRCCQEYPFVKQSSHNLKTSPSPITHRLMPYQSMIIALKLSLLQELKRYLAKYGIALERT